MTDAAPFCTNPACVLHVCADDQGVDGRGEWAVRPDGIVTGRARYDGRVLCDLCGRVGSLAPRLHDAVA